MTKPENQQFAPHSPIAAHQIAFGVEKGYINADRMFIQAPEAGVSEIVASSWPKKEELPCGCYMQPDYEGCTCGNYDDARRQGYAQGWNDAIEACEKARKEQA